jgi:hypothetical protein
VVWLRRMAAQPSVSLIKAIDGQKDDPASGTLSAASTAGRSITPRIEELRGRCAFRERGGEGQIRWPTTTH